MRDPVTLDDWDIDEVPPRVGGAFWPAWWWPVLVWLPLDAWHGRFVRELPRFEPGVMERAGGSPQVMAWVATAIVMVAALAEAGFYGMLWSARGRRLPLAAATVAVVQAGVLELLALRVIELAGPGAPWAAALAGARALAPRGAGASALATAFGGAGLLALARCALFAGLQAGLVRGRFREAFALTCAVWLASHVAQWWLLELVVGHGAFGRGLFR